MKNDSKEKILREWNTEYVLPGDGRGTGYFETFKELKDYLWKYKKQMGEDSKTKYKRHKIFD